MQVLAPRANPHSLALVIPIAVASFLANIGMGGAKGPANNDILWSVQNATLSGNTIGQIVRWAHHHCYKDVAMNIDSGMSLVLSFDKVERVVLGSFVKDTTIFHHSADKIISIRLNSGGAKGKDK